MGRRTAHLRRRAVRGRPSDRIGAITVALVVALVAALGPASPAGASARTATPPPDGTQVDDGSSDEPSGAPAPPPDGTQVDDGSGEPFEAPRSGSDEEAPADDPAVDGAVPDGGDGTVGEQPDDDETGDTIVDGEDAETTTVELVRRPTVRSSGIPLGSILLAIAVLAAVAFAWFLGRRGRLAPEEASPTGLGGSGAQSGRADRLASDRLVSDRPTSDARTLEFLFELGEALVDAGDAVHHVETSLQAVAEVNGIRGLGVIVLPTALMISVPGHDDVTTEVGVAGRARLRLDQVDAVLRLVHAAEAGDMSPEEGRESLARIRATPPPYSPPMVLAGYTLAATGLALILRGGWPEVPLAAALGALMGVLRFVTRSRHPVYQPFWPLIAAFLTAAVVFAAGRAVSDLIVFPTLVAPLVTFLPGALLTIGVFELATGQIIAGAARLASGALQLLLLALGIVAGASFVGIPVGGVGQAPQGPVGVLGPWIGVAVFGLGVAWFEGVRRRALLLVLFVLYVAYAGQVAGGLFFGSTLSAFFGAAAMTPVAVVAARQRVGPPMLVTFLPAFWLLVPGALGLDGVTRILGEESVDGTTALATAGAAMVGISLGILLGLAISAPDPSRPWSGLDATRRWSRHVTR